MIKLPKRKRDQKEIDKLCTCRPVCKNRRREWMGKVQGTSAELLLERKPLAECFRRWPMKIYPNSPCPLFARTGVIVERRDAVRPPPEVVRICQAPVDDVVDTTYLMYCQLAKEIGAWQSVKTCCAFCSCGRCCACGLSYTPHDAERADARRGDMRQFDARVARDSGSMRIMYDQI